MTSVGPSVRRSAGRRQAPVCADRASAVVVAVVAADRRVSYPGGVVPFLVSIVPSAGALFLFWFILRAILQADRRERAAIARYEAEHGLDAPAAAAADAEHGSTDDATQGEKTDDATRR